MRCNGLEGFVCGRQANDASGRGARTFSFAEVSKDSLYPLILNTD